MISIMHKYYYVCAGHTCVIHCGGTLKVSVQCLGPCVNQQRCNLERNSELLPA